MKQKKNQKGIWGDENSKKKNIKNISWSDSNVQEIYNKNKGTLTSIVEHVVSGSTIKVLIGNIVVSLHMTGVQCPTTKIEKIKNDKGEEVRHKKEGKLGKEAKYFTELSLLHRDVSLVLEGVDKFENLFGSIVLENNKCFQEELLSKGYATIAEWNVGNSKFSTVMRKAEQDAKKKKLKIFKKL